MATYFDKPDGSPANAAQVWRDAHTVDQLAMKIRDYLERVNNRPLHACTTYVDLAIQEYKP